MALFRQMLRGIPEGMPRGEDRHKRRAPAPLSLSGDERKSLGPGICRPRGARCGCALYLGAEICVRGALFCGMVLHGFKIVL